MTTRIDNLTVKRDRSSYRISGYVQSDYLNRTLEGWLHPKSILLLHIKSNNRDEQREAFIQLADILLEQNRRFDEMAGHLYINPIYPEVSNG